MIGSLTLSWPLLSLSHFFTHIFQSVKREEKAGMGLPCPVDNGAADALSRDDVQSSFFNRSRSEETTKWCAPGAGPGADTSQARLDLAELDRLAEIFFSRGLADSTQKAYRSSQKRFITFCRDGGLVAVPASEATLCRYVSFLAQAGLKAQDHQGLPVINSALAHTGCDYTLHGDVVHTWL